MYYTPPTRHRDEATVTRCKRSCCWSPYGHTAREGCDCHPKPQTTPTGAA